MLSTPLLAGAPGSENHKHIKILSKHINKSSYILGILRLEMLLVLVVREILFPLKDDSVQEGISLHSLYHVQAVVDSQLLMLGSYLFRNPLA